MTADDDDVATAVLVPSDVVAVAVAPVLWCDSLAYTSRSSCKRRLSMMAALSVPFLASTTRAASLPPCTAACAVFPVERCSREKKCL